MCGSTEGAQRHRDYLPLFPLIGVSFMDGYRAVSFLSWVPNLILAEIYLRGGFERPRTVRAAGPNG